MGSWDPQAMILVGPMVLAMGLMIDALFIRFIKMCHQDTCSKLIANESTLKL